MKHTVVVISVGSNSEDRNFRVSKAIEFLLGNLTAASVSSVYESESFSKNDRSPFTNAVVVGQTLVNQEEMITLLKEQEALAGRDAVTRAEGIVPLDLDIVIWGGRIVRNDDFERPYFNIGYRELLAKGAFEE
ncbi:MAG: 2-amino-4-hydroxy-6-hydroxymethyldihydropteridine diphosphokinase [Muribaculaceae bacterium]|nr:2-amino-4-hydroxy-6-hydroxymethyldihydropteridine diphosphokinase [Muribaculaceae bacterium]